MATLKLFTIQHAGDFSVMLFKETEGDRFLPMTTRNAQAPSVEGAQIVTHQRGNVAKIHDLLRDIITALGGGVMQVRLSSIDAHGDYRPSLELRQRHRDDLGRMPAIGCCRRGSTVR